MTAVLVVIAEAMACIGFGMAALRLLRLERELGPLEAVPFAFVIGFGVLGWLAFPLGAAGLLAGPWLAGLLALGVLGLLARPRFPVRAAYSATGMATRVLVGLLVLVLALDLAEGLAPPGDADTLAYHFTAPKLFLEAGRIQHILRPLDGAIPYLVQMTYLPALALGGETALTLWTMLSGWMAAALLFVLCRRHLDREWSLCVTILFLTTPVVVYAAGTGQIEVRTALFVMVAAWAAARALQTGNLVFALLAGLCVGFYGGSKYLGLLFAIACGVPLLVQRRWLAHGVVYSVTALAAGFQWYLWNAVHTGDPFFPMLFQWLGRDDLVLWTKAFDAHFKETFFLIDRAVPRTPWWFVLYPFAATLDPVPVMEAKRAGMGPYGLLVLPFAVLGAWRYRGQFKGHPLFVYGAIVLLFYALWFFTGASQRVRHLLPVLPLFLLCISAAAYRYAADTHLKRPLMAACAATLALQLAGDGLFSKKYVAHLARGEGREAFLARNISLYAPVPWINGNLGPGDRLLTIERQHFYFLNVPYFFASPHTQAAVDLDPGQRDPDRLFGQLRSQGVTHALLPPDPAAERRRYPAPFNILAEADCLVPLASIPSRRLGSRTLPGLGAFSWTMDVVKLKTGGCGS